VTPQAEFAALYERHHKALYRYCRSIVRHEEDAQDALQSTMTRAYAALQERPHDFDLRPWLFRIAHNESVSILRRRRPTQELDAELAALGGVDERAELQETLRIFRQDLADLPERQRSALVLRELNGLRPAEIAALLDTTPGAVKQTLLEARRALARCHEGRETPCFDVQRALMDGDGRVLRGRGLRAHLRSCTGCRRFRDDVKRRRFGLLPALLSALQGSGLFAKTAVVAIVAVTATAEVRTLQEPKHPRPVPAATPTAAPTVVVKPATALATFAPKPRPTAEPIATTSPTHAAKHSAPPAKPRRHVTQRAPAKLGPAPKSHAKPRATPTAPSAKSAKPEKQETQQKPAKPEKPAKPQAKATPKPTPPGQAKKQQALATPTPAPPGQAKKQEPEALPPGQAKKQAPATMSPGQAKKQADTS
jgi:RNA polymerase sigma factor (sigma-70 family)